MPDKDYGHGSQTLKCEVKDEGCAWYKSCLKCPMPQCRFDNKQPVKEEKK